MALRHVAPRSFADGRRYIAELDTDEETLRARFRIVFEDDEHAQAGPERFAVIGLSNGELLWLLHAVTGPMKGLLVIASDVADPERTRAELLRDVGLTE